MKVLVIQTAFIGDVILATAVAEEIRQAFPDASIDFLLRKGNEALLHKHPFIGEVIVWDKQKNKLSNLIKIILRIRKKRYDHLINLHRFASSGLITVFSGAKQTIGYNKNPFSFLFDQSISHQIGSRGQEYIHEIDRNHLLIASLTGLNKSKPRLYPSLENYHTVKSYQTNPYVCIAPSSVWFTKQWPKQKWIELIRLIPSHYNIYLLGAPSDKILAEDICKSVSRENVSSLCGKLNFLESAALMERAAMNYVNDSAPLHIASAMNAPVTAIFCSTIPEFGFGSSSDQSFLFQEQTHLSCRPCGLHGHKSCPEGHFKCAMEIWPEEIISKTLNTHIKVS